MAHRSGMSWCSEWIRDWLRKNDLSQTAFARLCGIGPDNVSRWLSGRSKPDREAVSRLVSRLDEADAAGWLVAWLRDCVPDGAEGLVMIESNVSADAAGDPVGFPPGMSAELRERLLFFGELALDNPDIRKIIDVCYQAAQRGAAEP